MNQTGAGLARERKPHRIAQLGADWPVHVFTLSFFVVWEIASWHMPSYLVPGPLEVADSVLWFLTSPAGLYQVAASVMHVGIALAAAFVVGTAIALLPYYVPILRLAVDGRFTPFVNSFPGIGWTFLAIVWLGLGFETVIFAVTVILLPFMIVNVREGVKTLDRDLIEMTRSFGSNSWQELVTIVRPTLLPFMFSAVRVSFGVSWKVTLTAELLGGSNGLGYAMNIARQELDMSRVFAVVVLIVACVFICNRFLFDPLQRQIQRGTQSAN